MSISPFAILSVLILFLTGSGCTSEPADPSQALPTGAGLVLYWQQGYPIPHTGFTKLDDAVDNLARSVPVRDSLEAVPYAAFAYNLRPGELAAGLAVATEQIRPPRRQATDIDYRGVTFSRIDSTRLLYATYQDLSLVAREAVIIQEMIDQLLEGANSALRSREKHPQAQIIQYTLPELGALFSSQTSENSRALLAQWGGDWPILSLYFQRDTLLDWHLETESPSPTVSAIECLPNIPAGIDHFAILPVPAANERSKAPTNWSTYFSPWLGDTYARIATDDGPVLAFCPSDIRLMRDLMDRLERDFAVAERINYPNGSMLRSEAPGLTGVLRSPLPAETWLLRTNEQLYLASSRTALETILDLQLLAGPQSLPAETPRNTPSPAMLARLNPTRLADQMTAIFSDWSAPRWWSDLEGWWSGTPAIDGITLRRYATTTTERDTTNTSRPSTGVVWRWEAPATIESIIPVPSTPQCAVYLQDGTLVVLDENQQEQVRTQLGAPPNSPVYRLPATASLPVRWLFSTPTAVYLIDTSGQVAPGFPYRPTGGLAAGIVLDDLDRATNPAYFVPLRTGRIEAYSLRGMPLLNWTVPNDFCAAAPLLTLHSDTSTYLAAVDTLSRVRIFDRRGDVYLTFDSLPNPFIGPLFGQLGPGTGPGRLTALELDGRIRVMSLAGGQFPLRTTLPTGVPRQLLFTDLWGDRRKDYLVSRADAAALYAYEKNDFAQRWQKSFPGTVDRIFTLPSLRLVGGLDRGRGLLYLLQGSNGELITEQGLAGRLPGQELITSDGRTLLITAYNRTLYAYQITAGSSI